MKSAVFVAIFGLLAVAAVSQEVDFADLNDPTTRIINGHIATPFQFPWHVSIQGRQLNNQETLCGGALISNTFVLTVAHCVAGNNFQFLTLGFGTNNLSRPLISLEVNPNAFNVRIVHPQYNAATGANDLALLRLPIPLNNIQPIASIRLPALSQNANPFTNLNVVHSGFGRAAVAGQVSQALRFAPSRVILLSQCSAIYGSTVANVNTLCTLGQEFDVQGPCANDNGGPLVLYEQNIPTLIGLQAFVSAAGCTAGQPGGFVRLGPFTQWISQNAGIPTRN